METQPLRARESLDLELGQYFDLLRRKWFVLALIWGGTFGLAGGVAFLKAPTYEAASKVLVKVDQTASLTGIGKGVGDITSISKNPLSTEIEIILASPTLERVIGTLDLLDEEGSPLTPKELRKKLDVEIAGGADVLKLSYTAKDPELATNVVNELSRVYIESNILDNQLQTSKARLLTEQQLPESERFVEQSEASLREFKEKNGIVSLQDEAKSVVITLQGLDNQVLSVKTDLDEATSKSNQLRNTLGLDLPQAMMASDLSQSPAVQNVLLELQKLERQKAIKLGTYKAQSPVIQTASQEEQFLKQLLREEIAAVVGSKIAVPDRYLQMGSTRQELIAQFSNTEVQRLGLQNRLQTLEGYRSRYLSRAASLPSLEQQQKELERTQEVARQSYQENLRRLRDLQVAEEQSIGNATLLEAAALPDEPNRTSQQLLLGFGGLAGALFAAGAAAVMAFGESNRNYRQARGGIYVPPAAPTSTEPKTQPLPSAETGQQQPESA